MLASTFLSLFPASTKHYRKMSAFAGIKGSVHALALSTDRQTLAAGGTQGVRLWNLKSHKELPRVTYLGSRSAVSCTVWVKTKIAISEMLCYGTGMGYLVFLQTSSTNSELVTMLSKCWHSAQLINYTQSLQADWIILFQKHVAFSEAGIIYMFGLYDGNVDILDQDVFTLTSSSGSAAVNFKKGIFIVNNATDGFTMYCLESGQPVRTFITTLASIPIPKQVAFGEESKVMIGGSDTGCVYVFSRQMGALIETLSHTNTTLVQTIAVGSALSHVHPLLWAVKRLWSASGSMTMMYEGPLPPVLCGLL
ncbi:hypothetical protein EDC04DRAFT_2605598 [Pisolithus marmoratus]|nr:hypothetical protein EDC04DRAFT_2605598 [Pisolithus marmoratus]